MTLNVLVVGDFCVGKDTVADNILDILSNRFHYETNKIISYTTREPRYEGEDTHIFCSKEEFLNFDDIVAETKIADQYYGARASQFKKDCINVYVVDEKGVHDVINARLNDPIFVIEVFRPNWLRDCPESRIKRDREYGSYSFYIDYRIVNDGDLNKLRTICQDCSHAILDFLYSD